MVSASHCYFGFCASAVVLYFAFSVCALFCHVASVYFYVAENAALSLASSAETEISAAASCQAAAGIVVVVVPGGLAAGFVVAGGCLAAAGIPAGAAGTWVAAASAEIGTESAVNTFCFFLTYVGNFKENKSHPRQTLPWLPGVGEGGQGRFYSEPRQPRRGTRAPPRRPATPRRSPPPPPPSPSSKSLYTDQNPGMDCVSPVACWCLIPFFLLLLPLS